MKVFITKKRTVILALACVLLIALLITFFSISDGAASVYFGTSLRKSPINCVKTEEKVIAITFDAAYGVDKTEDILEILSEYEADATFFLTGDWVQNFPERTQKIADEGFEIGTHSNTHPHMTRLAVEDIKSELKLSKEKIEFYTKSPVTLFRPPFGEYSDNIINSAENLNLKTIQWNIDSYDWKNIAAKDVLQRVTEKAKSGSIVLFHTNSENILNILPIVLLTLQNKGFSFKKVSDMLYSENYKIDNSGMQYLIN